MNQVKAKILPSSGGSAFNTATSSSSSMSMGKVDEVAEWEMRPGGMLVQKRSDNVDRPAPNIRVRVAYGAARFEISVSSQATFGELKKLLTPHSGLKHWEQTLFYRGKERANKEFLDICGVKERSKVILVEDPFSREKRLLEMCKNNKIQRVHTAISDISNQLDCLIQQVFTIEKSIKSGTKVAEVQITTLIELLMTQAVKLDSISVPTEGEVSALKKLQAKRVQKCVETLDVLKLSNAILKPAIVTTKWETFDSPSNTPHYWNLLD